MRKKGKKIGKKKYVIRKKFELGKIERGAIFVVVILTAMIFAGYIFVGGNIPTTLPKPNTNLVQIIQPKTEPAKNNLQLYTFYGATITPYPTLNSGGGPFLNNTPVSPVDCGHS